jgi:hypothetical protein
MSFELDLFSAYYPFEFLSGDGDHYEPSILYFSTRLGEALRWFFDNKPEDPSDFIMLFRQELVCGLQISFSSLFSHCILGTRLE